jgi:hypothetical protein
VGYVSNGSAQTEARKTTTTHYSEAELENLMVCLRFIGQALAVWTRPISRSWPVYAGTLPVLHNLGRAAKLLSQQNFRMDCALQSRKIHARTPERNAGRISKTLILWW